MRLLEVQRQRGAGNIDWAPAAGRELGSERLDETPVPWRIVACLNVWNDRAALEQTLPTWYDHVDSVIAVDGAYPAHGVSPCSDDGTREFLGALGKVSLITLGHATQLEKRTAYLETGRLGDLLFIIDADEIVTGAQHLRETPMLDVGWCRLSSRLYRRTYGQPRVIRAQPGLRYAGRHHWIYAGDRLLATHQYGGVGFDHRTVNVSIENRRGLGHSNERRVVKHALAEAQHETESVAVAAPHTEASDRQLGKREPLRIVMAAMRDDGIAPSRLHTALNRTTPHASLLFKGEPGPFGVPEGYSTTGDRKLYAQALAEADVVHFHVAFLDARRSTPQQAVVIHHHGTHFRRHVAPMTVEAARRGALVLVSNLELLTYAPNAHYLPNVVPVARYRRLRTAALATPDDGRFRVVHSPSRPEKKGTAEFQAACARLQARGYPIEPVILTGCIPHAEVLAIKATCDAAFDSFWLGMQCSGLEAAAMGLPVIAGDAQVADRHREMYGAVPYTFAGDGEQLEHELQQLMDHPDYLTAEADRVSAHVLAHHDESAVALRYLDLLDTAFGWRSR